MIEIEFTKNEDGVTVLDEQEMQKMIAAAMHGEEVKLIPKKEMWKFNFSEHGGYVIGYAGILVGEQLLERISVMQLADYGNYYPTEAHAEFASKQDLIRNRIRQFVNQEAPNFIQSENYRDNWFVTIRYDDGQMAVCGNSPELNPCTVYMPKDTAIRLCDLYNAGLIDLGDK